MMQITKQSPCARVAVIDEPLDPPEQSSLIMIGVHGFIPYDRLDKDLPDLVSALMSGKLWYEARVLEHHILARERKATNVPSSRIILTSRQRQILALIQRGFSNKEMSAELKISESTVKFHLAKMFDKFGVRNKRSLVSQQEIMLQEEGPLDRSVANF